VAPESVASELARTLTDRGLPASVRPLPPWPSTTPNSGEAIIVDVAGAPRPIALVEWSKVTAYAPPWIGEGRWAAQTVGGRWVMPVQEIAAGLVDLAHKWSREPEALGLLDVVFTLLDTLPAVDGGWRALVLDREAWIGVERGRLRWPAPLRLDVRREIEIAHTPPPPDVERRWSARTRADLDRDRPVIEGRATALMAWCEHFVEEKRALEKFAGQVCVELAKTHLPPAGQWSVWTASIISTRERPSAWIQWEGGLTHITTDDAGHGVVDGATYPDDTTMTALANAIAARAHAQFVLRPGELYRLRQPLRGYLAGDVLRFIETVDIRPNDTPYHRFEAADPHLGRGPSHVDGNRGYHGLGLSEVDPEDARITNALPDWFEHVVDPVTARARRIDALAAAAKLLLAHKELDAAEARLQEALALDPDHVEALFQAGWAAVMRDRWQDAYVLFERASSRDARHLDARNNTAWALGRLGRWQEALAILDVLLVVRPDWKLVHTNRAWVLRGLGRVEEAAEEDARAAIL
jgi:hypothetical protein